MKHMTEHLKAGQISAAIAGVILASNAATTSAYALEEVIVTAQKRGESVQDVPMGITAISAETLANTGISDTTGLVKLSPSLTVVEGQSKQRSSFNIRGIGTNVYSMGVESSVAVVIDDVSTAQAGQAMANLNDIESVEVLRGPQSTLFGKSASAGLINVRTKAPAEYFEAEMELTGTDDNETRMSAMVSAPLSDTLGYRLSGYWSELDGFVDNLTEGEKVNSDESQGLRSKLRWQISDSVQADITAYYSEDESTCCVASWLNLDPDARVFGIVPESIAPGITPSDENRSVRADDAPVSETENSGLNIRLEIDLGDYSFVSISAYDDWQYYNTQDVDNSEVDVQGIFTGGTSHGGISSESKIETEVTSQEFRLLSPSFDHYDYLVGLYYGDVQNDRTFKRNEGLPTLPLYSIWDAESETKNLALFSHLNWHITETTQLSMGLRWQDEEISVDYVNPSKSRTALSRDSDTVVLGNLSLQHYLDGDVMLYASYAQGYKGQAYNINSSFSQNQANTPVAPETSDAFEVGIKTTLFEQRIQLNAALFHTEFQDFQAQNSTIDDSGALATELRNVGVVETQGLELEGTALVTEDLTLRFGATYLDASIKLFDGAPCYRRQTVEQGCSDSTQNLNGVRLNNAPEWKVNLLADYHLELSSMPFNGFINASYVWQDDFHFNLTNNPVSYHEDFGIVNLSMGITEKDREAYRLTLFVNNLTNENYRGGIADASHLFGGKEATLQILPRGSQRYFGARLKFKW